MALNLCDSRTAGLTLALANTGSTNSKVQATAAMRFLPRTQHPSLYLTKCIFEAFWMPVNSAVRQGWTATSQVSTSSFPSFEKLRDSGQIRQMRRCRRASYDADERRQLSCSSSLGGFDVANGFVTWWGQVSSMKCIGTLAIVLYYIYAYTP